MHFNSIKNEMKGFGFCMQHYSLNRVFIHLNAHLGYEAFSIDECCGIVCYNIKSCNLY